MRSSHTISNRLLEPKERSYHWVRGLDSIKTCFDERALAVFQADILTREQYLATYKRKIQLDPERALMLAVLQDAVVCFQEYVGSQKKRKRRLFLDAEEWILSRDHFYLFSFENVCALLGFDADYLRCGLMRWKNKALGLNRRQLGSHSADPIGEQLLASNFNARAFDPSQFLAVQTLHAVGAGPRCVTKSSGYERAPGRATTTSKVS
ncbi:MAG TPA: hypothetical protein VEI95_14285 [Acidobacteriota bacterium]|nr:hypothetical protein [Acidobacteriota bacterium]